MVSERRMGKSMRRVLQHSIVLSLYSKQRENLSLSTHNAGGEVCSPGLFTLQKITREVRDWRRWAWQVALAQWAPGR
jgi:hypothetical protein